jgi:hypothetical protein
MKLGTNDIGSVYLGTNAVQKVYLGTNEVWSAFSSGLLDTYSGAAAAYSLRRLSILYTGSAIEVRRASDNSTQDIGFSGEDLDVAAVESFCSGTNGFVTKWYDQSGNARNATQTTAANQPQIVSSGSVISKNGKPAIYGNGTTTNSYFELSTIQNTPTYYSIITVYSHNNALYSTCPFAHRNSNNDLLQLRMNLSLTPEIQIRSSGTGLVRVIDSLVSLNSQNLYFAQYNNATPLHSLVTNANSPVTDSTSMAGTIIATKNYIGGTSANGTTVDSFISGELQELIIYTTDQSSNRTGISDNINDFYSIY